MSHAPAADAAAAGLLAEDDAPADETDLLAGLGHRLRATGLPVDRIVLYQRTLHPDILARAVAWAPDEPIEVYDRDHGLDLSRNFVGSLLQQAMESGESAIVRPDRGCGPTWAWDRSLCRRDLVELVLLPLAVPDGPVSALVIGTSRAGGFAAGERAWLDRAMPALAALYEAALAGAG